MRRGPQTLTGYPWGIKIIDEIYFTRPLKVLSTFLVHSGDITNFFLEKSGIMAWIISHGTNISNSSSEISTSHYKRVNELFCGFNLAD